MKYHIAFLGSLIMSTIAYGQNNVTFMVSEESGIPLTGATVVIEGTTTGSVTNTEGITRFENLSDGKMVFYISFVGYEGVSVRLTFPEDNNRTLEVELEEM